MVSTCHTLTVDLHVTRKLVEELVPSLVGVYHLNGQHRMDVLCMGIVSMVVYAVLRHLWRERLPWFCDISTRRNAPAGHGDQMLDR